MPRKFLIGIATLLCIVAVGNSPVRGQEMGSGYPKIFGMNIGGPIYYGDPVLQQKFSRHDVLVLGFYKGWDRGGEGQHSMRDVVRVIKALNPHILIGQYTILSESQDSESHPSKEKARKLTTEGWWLVDKNKERVRWTSKYNAWDINVTKWAPPDRNGLRYPEWLARYDYWTFFKPVPEFDIWYFDNVPTRPSSRIADWDLDGRNDGRDEPRIATAYRQANVMEWEEARRLKPQALFIGNAPDLSSPEYKGRLQGAFLEFWMGRASSIEARHGWDAAMSQYRAVLQDTAAPHIVAINVHGRPDDYQLMRFGLTSCLLEDGYFSYTEIDSIYRTVSWFDEFDANLGQPTDPPSRAPWKNGVYRRNFEHGVVFVNPSRIARTIILEPGYRHIDGKQDPITNNGKPVRSVTIQARDGLILLKASS